MADDNKPASAEAPIEQQLYAIRQTIQTRAVHGVFANWRVALVLITQLVYYGLPWLQWDNRQAVLFDLAARKFYIFGLVFWPQDFVYLTGLLILSALSLFLFTAVAGRLWCGYACPQTVYTEIFMWVESWLEGDHVARKKLDDSPWNANKLKKRGAQACRVVRDRAVDRLHLRRLLHADQGTGRRVCQLRPRAVGNLLDFLLRLRHLGQRRLHARAGVQVHVPLRALPERDVRLRHADRDLRQFDRRAARLAQQEDRLQGRRPRHLRRLQRLRAGLPHRHRHPQRPAIRMHRLRRLHRRLRPDHGQDGLPARADPLHHRKRGEGKIPRQRHPQAHAAPAHASFTPCC